MNVDTQILIAGGGPAGLAAGIRAAQHGLQATIVEPKSPPIDKACGEGLMPAALERMAQLGVEVDRLVGHPFRGIRYVDAEDPSRTAMGDFPTGPGKGVRRVELHRALADRAAELGVQRREGRVDAVERGADFVEAAGLRARWLIGADGLHSTVRRELGMDAGMRKRHPRRFGIRRHYAVAPWVDRVEVHWSGRAEAYVTPVGPETVGVAMLFEESGRFDELLEYFPRLRGRIRGAEQLSEDRGGGPFEQRVPRRVDDSGRVLLVGDAAGYVDPLTGEGVALAVETACAAVESIVEGRPHDYEQEWRRRTREYFLLTEGLLTLTRPRWTHRPLIALLDTIPGVFDWFLGRLSS